jgi:hypothetical protein
VEHVGEILVGGIGVCDYARHQGVPIIHATKFPCYWNAVDRKQPRPGHWNYLIVNRGGDLFLNMIDGEERYFMVELFLAAFQFLDQHHGKVAIHCNQGRSRAPSIALLWMARTGRIPGDTFLHAIAQYPGDYLPSRGLSDFITHHWTELVTR